jgi:hypothetical protein
VGGWGRLWGGGGLMVSERGGRGGRGGRGEGEERGW